jgi:hypothetical protein
LGGFFIAIYVAENNKNFSNYNKEAEVN